MRRRAEMARHLLQLAFLFLAMPSLAAAQPGPCTVEDDIHFRVGTVVLKVPRSYDPGGPVDRRRILPGGAICDHTVQEPAFTKYLVFRIPIENWPEQIRTALWLKFVSVVTRQKCDRSLLPPQTVKTVEDPELDENHAFRGSEGKHRILHTKVGNTAVFDGSFHKIECFKRFPNVPMACQLRMGLKSACVEFFFHGLPVAQMQEFSSRAEIQLQKMIVESR
jgi:hypothetical protein